MKKRYVLGISALYHNSAAALLCDGEIVAAAEEERFTRKKADASFPVNAIGFCLDSAGIDPEDLDRIAFYENPAEKFGRILTSAGMTAPKSITQFLAAVPDWVGSMVMYHIFPDSFADGRPRWPESTQWLPSPPTGRLEPSMWPMLRSRIRRSVPWKIGSSTSMLGMEI